MQDDKTNSPRLFLSRVGSPIRLGLMLAAALTLGACDTTRDVVDTVNPINWFEDDGEPERSEAETAAETADDETVPGEDEDYPNVGAVPERPAEPSIKREYEELQSGLVSDRENAAYSNEELRREEPPERMTEETRLAQESNVQPTDLEGGAPGGGESLASSVPQPVEPAPRAQPAPKPQPVPEATAPPPAPRPATPPPSAAELARSQPGEAQQGQVQQDQSQPTRSQPDANTMQEVAIIYFPNGGSKLSAHDKDVLRQVARIFHERRAQSITVVGHSSTKAGTGSAQRDALVNYKISLDRANAVAWQIVANGVPQQVVDIEARGATEPKYSEATPNGEAGNRRVEIYFQTQG